MSDQRIGIAFTMYHPPADPNGIRPLIEKLRLKAIDLGLLRVGDLVYLNGDRPNLRLENLFQADALRRRGWD